MAIPPKASTGAAAKGSPPADRPECKPTLADHAQVTGTRATADLTASRHAQGTPILKYAPDGETATTRTTAGPRADLCNRCGAENHPRATFCRTCGETIPDRRTDRDAAEHPDGTQQDQSAERPDPEADNSHDGGEVGNPPKAATKDGARRAIGSDPVWTNRPQGVRGVAAVAALAISIGAIAVVVLILVTTAGGTRANVTRGSSETVRAEVRGHVVTAVGANVRARPDKGSAAVDHLAAGSSVRVTCTVRSLSGRWDRLSKPDAGRYIGGSLVKTTAPVPACQQS